MRTACKKVNVLKINYGKLFTKFLLQFCCLYFCSWCFYCC